MITQHKNILIPVFLFPFLVLAQAPGYIGKKSVAGYGFDFSPAFNGPTAGVPFNFTQQLYFEKVTKTNLSIGVAIKHCYTRYDNKVEIYKLGNPTSDFTIQAFSFSPYAKVYSKKYVAPWGKYWMFGPVVNITNTKYDGYMYLTQAVSDHDTLLRDFGPTKQTFYSVDLLIGKGKSRVFAKKIIVDYGFNFHLIALLNGLTGSDFSNITQQNYIKLTAIDRIRGVNRFNLFLKIGYLF